jgi:hypothetical protein
MNSDIVARLQQTFSGIPDGSGIKDIEPPLHDQLEGLFRRDLSADEETLIRAYRRMSVKKQEALKNLLG